ncbi:hypothetical protein [Phytomonospora endophytica]|uniref:Uncharacterized protein n=1 Tax=Phytomonospora endophytica TaxID=714109 RepID=A0A841FB51_9ACTN|nr:hypothetical protein [Phytomonospora endophytica]MBB6033004.1 hypothetical protein [Phytomonospora endophytica]GIG65230.1 hypothetical protein Pen01_15250 [Phytomonospora endophytica]
MGKIIIPVGRSLGPFFDDEGELESYELHLGHRMDALDSAEMYVWACAHDNPEAHGELSFGRAELTAACREAEVPLDDDAVGKTADLLIERGAMLEVDLDGPELESVLSAHRFIPNGHAFGNRPDAPDECGVGTGDEPDITMGGWVYTLWARSYLDGSVLNACEAFAADLPEVETADVAREFAEALPVIIAADCGYLEPVE